MEECCKEYCCLSEELVGEKLNLNEVDNGKVSN